MNEVRFMNQNTKTEHSGLWKRTLAIMLVIIMLAMLATPMVSAAEPASISDPDIYLDEMQDLEDLELYSDPSSAPVSSPPVVDDAAPLPPNFDALAGFVLSVEHVNLIVSGSKASALLTKGQNTANCVPFESQEVRSTSDDFDEIAVDVYFEGGNTVSAERDCGGGTVYVSIYVVEFDPAFVRVQQGTFDFSGSSQSVGINTVDQTKAAMIFYYVHTDDNDDWDDVKVTGYFDTSSSARFERYSTADSVDGHFFIFEALNNEFSVQTAGIYLHDDDENGFATINPVDMRKTFILASYKIDESSDNSDEGACDIWLDDPTTVRMSRYDYDEHAQAYIFIIEFNTGGRVQHGEFYFAGYDMIETVDILPVNLPWSMVHSPQVWGQSRDSGSASSDVQGVWVQFNFVDANTIQGTVDDEEDSRRIHWQVIEWYPPDFGFFADPPVQSRFGWRGDYVEHEITISNIGTEPDVYLPTFGNWEWRVQFLDFNTREQSWWFGPLQPGESLTFIAQVRIPRGVNSGDMDPVTLNIRSNSNENINQDVQIITRTSLPVPYYNDFESGVFGQGITPGDDWATDMPSQAGVSTHTANSGDNSMYTRWGPVSITSAPFYMERLPGGRAILSSWIQRGGPFSEDPDAGEDLFVEYIDDKGNWNQLGVFMGAGTPGQIFPVLYDLPPDAMHEKSQVRFRQAGGSGVDSDYWHIDDVYIGPPDPNFDLWADDNEIFGGPGDTVVYDMHLQNNALHPDSYEISIQNNAWPTDVLFLDDDFNDGNFGGWTVVDEGANSAPSNWYVDGPGRVRETSNIHSWDSPEWSGSYLYYNNGMAWNDYVYQTSINPVDNDGIGVMFRYNDNDNYYRFRWMNQYDFDGAPGIQKRVLDVCNNGVWTTLASDGVPYVLSQWYDFEVRAIGDRITTYIDGIQIFDVIDNSIDGGTVALYTWGHSNNYFDDVMVYGASQIPGGPILVGPLPSGETFDFTVSVQVPTDARLGDFDAADVVATSIFGPSQREQLITRGPTVHNTDMDTWHGTIQNAVDNANPGDNILAYPNTYPENVVVDKPLAIQGQDRANTIVGFDGGIPDVLLVYCDPNPEPLLGQLNAIGGISVIDTYDARSSTPSLTLLQAYDVVLTWSDYSYSNPTLMGDIFADYIDSGGRMITMMFAETSYWGIQGRFFTGGYAPINYGASSAYSWSNLGTFDASHPIMNGITAAGDYYRGSSSTLNPNSYEIARWDDGRLFVAAKDDKSAVSISSYPGTYRNWNGQVDKIVHNALLWLGGDGAGSLFNVTSDNVSINGFTMHGAGTGVLLDGVQGCTISGNTIRDTKTGIHLFNSGNNEITGNALTDNRDGLFVEGNPPAPYDTFFTDDFTADSGRWSYYSSASRTGGYVELTPAVGGQVGQIWFDTPISSGMQVEFDYRINGNADGMAMMFYKDQAYVPSNGGSLGFDGSDGYGVEFDHWDNGANDPSGEHIAITQDNTATHLAWSNQNIDDNAWHHVKVIVGPSTIEVYHIDMVTPIMTWNGAISRTYGGFGFTAATGGATATQWIDNVDLSYSTASPMGNNTIYDNLVENNNRGMVFNGASGNQIYHNDIINNGIQALDDGSTNIWDNSYPSGGNFWSDYGGVDANNDQIGDTPYVIDGDSQDNFPLWNQFTTNDFTQPIHLFEQDPVVTTKTNYPGNYVDYIITVKNTGNVQDVYDLAFDGNAWATEILDASGTITLNSIGPIQPGDSLTFTVRVFIPALSGAGDADTVNIITASQWIPTMTVVDTFNTVAVEPAPAIQDNVGIDAMTEDEVLQEIAEETIEPVMEDLIDVTDNNPKAPVMEEEQIILIQTGTMEQNLEVTDTRVTTEPQPAPETKADKNLGIDIWAFLPVFFVMVFIPTAYYNRKQKRL